MLGGRSSLRNKDRRRTRNHFDSSQISDFNQFSDKREVEISDDSESIS